MKEKPPEYPALTMDAIVQRIFELRGQRVMLDADLAVLYGVSTKALLQAVRRNPTRFESFVFQLSTKEWGVLRSQNVTSKHGGRRYSPYVFTEHGALMLSSVLKSARAEEISRMIIRAFVWLRQTIPAYKELAAKVAELESAVGKHDAALNDIIETLRQLIIPPDKEKRRIGF
ncbi:MAG: ORF6N domain-containing protein [Acidobacteriota bacterium]|jgi:hypothetical protein|nr:ORF6N domain-containing protein [Acidobacteriota bacterium]